MTVEARKSGFYSDLETQSPEERAAYQWKKLRAVLAAAENGSLEFARRMEPVSMAVADVTDFGAWGKIPVFRKKDLIGFQQEHGLRALLSGEVGELGRIYMSPGPIFDPEGTSSDYWGWTEGFHAAGFRKNDVVQMTFGYHLTPAGLMLEEPLRELGCAVIPAGPGNTDVQIELLTKLPVTGFVGMASYLRVIKDKARQQGFDLKQDLKLEVAFVAAERLSASLRAELEEDLGMLVRQGYGTADLGCAAYECPELTGMHLSSRCYVEICDPKTGEPLPVGDTGEVVVTPFTTDYPLVRLATGDLSYLVDDPCPCGRTSARLGGIVGRVDDTAKVKGQFIYPHQVAEVVAGFPEIRRWQVVVSNPGGRDAIALRLFCAGDVDDDTFVRAFQAKCKLKPQLDKVSEGDIAEDAPPLVDERTFD